MYALTLITLITVVPPAQEQLVASQTVWDFLISGGYIMIPLAICSVIVLALTMERYLNLSRRKVVPAAPGPGRPEEAGVSLAMIEVFAEKIPMLGVCLGHQCLVSHFGGDIVRADRLMHGKTSMVKHDSKTVFAGLSEPFEHGSFVHHQRVTRLPHLDFEVSHQART